MNSAARRMVLALIALLSGALVFSAPAWGAIAGEITRAEASHDWTHGSIAGSVSGLDGSHHVWSARAYVVPHGVACPADQLPDPYQDYRGPYPPNPSLGVTELVWESSAAPPGIRAVFDIADVPLNSGIWPRICLYAVYTYIFSPGLILESTLLASRLFTVRPPPPPVPRAQAAKPAVTLSRTTAYAKAKSALKARYGRAYRRGKRKRLSCAKRSATRYRCTYSFRHRKKSRKGFVTVTIKPNGSVTTKVKRR